MCTWERGDTKKALKILGDGADINTLKALPRQTIRVPGKSAPIEVNGTTCRTWLPRGGPIGSQDAIRKIYGDSGGVDVLSDVASTFKSDRLFVQSSIVAGAIGPLYFKASYGQFFGSEESEEPGLTREELRDRSSNLLRLIQNGGSATARVLLPLVWGGGAASQQAVGVYFNAGGLGPMERPTAFEQPWAW